uniref:DNA 5'-3' helicase n=1 Tax=Dermatophagoides pteronyssinus TaxID=6956 RepID=A0A6P6Y5V7_DERPT|nr:ATP-dependent DNA helicase DDX11-like [Dermatophagoides pteronyssinus]
MSDQRNYQFPYQPYDIQIKLMNQLYDSFENGYISIVESPTGTGKSLSIICSLAKWMEDYKLNQLQKYTEEIDERKRQNQMNEKNDDWLATQLKQMTNNNEINDLNLKLEKLTKHIGYSKELKKRKTVQQRKMNQQSIQVKRNSNDVDDDLDLEDLIIQFDEDVNLNDDDDEKNSDYFLPKIYYCSRTHSQLSQFINEFKKTRYYQHNPNSLMLIPLSSRVNYCINQQVNHFNNLNMINEKCNDLQQQKNSKQKCQYKNQQKILEFGQEILAHVNDIEEIVTVAKQRQACPYYSARIAIPESEIVVMPYNILLHRSTRENFNIQLKDSIVIVDEAHNLLETISNVHSIQIYSRQLSSLLKYLSLYMTKYLNRFNSLNLKYLKQLIFVIRKLYQYLLEAKTNTCLQPLDLTIKLNIENINIHELLQFIERSRIASKLHMFSNQKSVNDKNRPDKIIKSTGTLEFLKKFSNNQAKASGKQIEESNVNDVDDEFLQINTIHLIKDFLSSLINYNVDAKILIQIDNDDNHSSYKYLLLSPSSHFKDILQECRSVILCGGTMKPFNDYINQLFRPLNINDNRTKFFSCNHVIDDDKLIAIGCSYGPNNIRLNYSFQNRNSTEIVKETGHLLVDIVKNIPKGIVVFFPSYDYQEFLLKRWSDEGIMKLFEQNQKRIFREPKKNSQVQLILNNYSKFIKSSTKNSAILFSVIGGKMSEGINFSDDLGRGIIVIGLPYANRNSIELMEKIEHLNRIASNAGNEYYENLCMRAVNQSIGRAIRHQNDYATIILIDERYGKLSVNSKLSDWIRTRFRQPSNHSEVRLLIQKFFQNKQVKND